MNANRTHFFLLIGFAIILFSLINLFIKTIPLVFAHAIYFCQRIFTNAIAFSHAGPSILLVLLSFVFIVGALILTIQIVKTKSFIKNILKRRILHPQKLLSIAQGLGLDDKIDVVKDKNHFSFCYGLLIPRVCVSRGLIKNLTQEELKAVFLHESYHLKNYDPLRILLGKTAALMLFFIPTLRDIQAHYIFSKEISADEVVIRSGHKESLISALAKLLSPSVQNLSGVAAFADSHSLENRILYLTGQKQISIRLSKRNLLLSFFGALLLFIVLNLPVHAIAVSDKDMDRSYFICPFGGSCMNSCKKEFETMSSKNLSEEVPYTPVK